MQGRPQGCIHRSKDRSALERQDARCCLVHPSCFYSHVQQSDCIRQVPAEVASKCWHIQSQEACDEVPYATHTTGEIEQDQMACSLH